MGSRAIKSILAITGLSVISILTACAGGGANSLEGFAAKCAETAYDEVFYGGSEHDYSERTTISFILKAEAEGRGEVSDAAVQKIINQIGPGAAPLVVSAFDACMADAPKTEM